MKYHGQIVALMAVGLMANLSSGHAGPPDSPPKAEPPAWIKPAFDQERVRIDYYDPARPPREYPGWTDFEFQLNYRFDYQHRAPTERSRRLTVIIVPTFTRIDVPVRHLIRLPKHYDTPSVFETVLMRHELEHVAIGSHRRVVLLAEHIVKKIRRLERRIDHPGQITNDWIGKEVDAEVVLRREAIEALVIANNKQLDKLTGHGGKLLADPTAFFDNLYLKENLDETRFPYLPDVLDLLNRREYQEARWECPAPAPDKSAK